MDHSVLPSTVGILSMLSLEITGKCNLECVHCYAGSGPTGTHGSMTTPEWLSLIDEAKQIGCRRVQFIGGEPTLHPNLDLMIRRAHKQGMLVEVYSNLVTIPEHLWTVFRECDVNLATGYYSSNPDVHDRVTGRQRSQSKTLANISAATKQGYSVRVGITLIYDQKIP